MAGADQDSLQTATQPHNAEAYALFLRSIPALDPAPNEAAIAMLQRSVALDPGYAPAWAGLGLRYYYSSFYGSGGTAALERMVAAYERALQLDRNLVTASAHFLRPRLNPPWLVDLLLRKFSVPNVQLLALMSGVVPI